MFLMFDSITFHTNLYFGYSVTFVYFSKHPLWICYATRCVHFTAPSGRRGAPKDLWRAIKKFWNIITKIALKVYLQLWRRSQWPGSSVSKECSKSEHPNGGLPVLAGPIAIFRSNLPDAVCNMFSEGLSLLCHFRVE